jgi:hypothetical protein
MKIQTFSTAGSDTSYLHINTAVATQIESGAVNIAGVTADIDGDIRQEILVISTWRLISVLMSKNFVCTTK